MDTQHEIRLRLRFFKDISENIEIVRQKFIDYSKTKSPDYLIKIRDNHVQFTIKGEKQKYWSPHLTLELEEKEGDEKNTTHIRGLFGPAQTMWTFFMFLHFVVAGVFIIFGMMAFSNFSLNEPYIKNIIVMFLMVFIWFLLYVIARQMREKGHEQMNELEKLFQEIIES